MANSDDTERVLAACDDCGAAYAAYQWSDGDVKPIGSDRCSCGSTQFVLIDDD